MLYMEVKRKPKHQEIYQRDFKKSFSSFLEELTPKEKEIITDLFTELNLEVGEFRLLKYLLVLRLLHKKRINLSDLNEESIKDSVRIILSHDIGTESKITYLIVFRSILKRLMNPYWSIPSKYIQILKKKLNPKMKLRKKELTPQEVNIILSHARSQRMKTILTILADTGMRIGELLSLQLKDIQLFDDYFLLGIESGKTSQSLDYVPLPRSAGYLIFGGYYSLMDWLNHHKVKLLFDVSKGKRQLKDKEYQRIYQTLLEKKGKVVVGTYNIEDKTIQVLCVNLFHAKRIDPTIFLFHKRGNPWRPILHNSLARELKEFVSELRTLNLIPSEKIITFHTFRHTRAYISIRYDHMEIDAVKILLRHSNIKTTTQYYDYGMDEFLEDKVGIKDEEKRLW